MDRASAARSGPLALERGLAAANQDTTVTAQQALRRGARPSVVRIVASPLARFGRSYLLGLGFLRGARGLERAVLDALAAFLEEAKLWELSRTPHVVRGPADAGGDRPSAREEAAR